MGNRAVGGTQPSGVKIVETDFPYVIPTLYYVLPAFLFVLPSFPYVIPDFPYVIPAYAGI